jgi:hypothetical protein
MLLRLFNIRHLSEAFPLCEDYVPRDQRLLTTDGVIARREHPELDTKLSYLVRRGDLARVLPGIYAAADQAMSLTSRLRALNRLTQTRFSSALSQHGCHSGPMCASTRSNVPSGTVERDRLATASLAGTSRPNSSSAGLVCATRRQH